MKKSSRLSIAVLILPMVPLLLGQSAGTGALSGTVTDASGAILVNATITLTNTATNQTRTGTTSADGGYRFSLLEPGLYRARFTATGFKTAEVGPVTVNVTETAVLNRSLEVGAASEQITVEAVTAPTQPASSPLATTVTGGPITTLPQARRNFTQVIGM